MYLSACLPVALQPLVEVGLFFSFLISIQSAGLLGRESAHRKTATYTGQHKHRINAHNTFMPRMGFELTIPVFERAKTVHALDRVAIVIGPNLYSSPHINITKWVGHIRQTRKI
jgi:hypothetical protein